MQVQITTTCIRVPVMRAHAESINLEFEKDITVEEVRKGSIACLCMCVSVCFALYECLCMSICLEELLADFFMIHFIH